VRHPGIINPLRADGESGVEKPARMLIDKIWDDENFSDDPKGRHSVLLSISYRGLPS